MPIPNYKIGEVFSNVSTYPTNATIVGDFLYVRDENGNILPGKSVDIGDRITVLDVGYDKQLALVQYPTSKGFVQAYVSNSTNIIKYDRAYSWKNGSTSEPVLDDRRVQIGTLDPFEGATLLYEHYIDKDTIQYCVLYDTTKGKHTKSGFVDFEGIPTVGLDVAPGTVIGSKPSYPTNATVINDFLYLRDEKGNLIPGRQVDIGDKITVLDVGYTRQLTLVQYPTSKGYVQGYVSNVTSIIKYDKEYNWCNGSTVEPVRFDDGREGLGSLDPYERATLLYKHDSNGMYHVVYRTSKGENTKSGYVVYEGTGVPPSVTLPAVNEPNVTKIKYGDSGLGRPLEVYKIGNGKKVLFAGFGIHGFEDLWFRDSIGLAHIANELIKSLAEKDRKSGLNGWTVYVSQCMNPDGLMEGWTNNGPGRCTVTKGIDLNRSFPAGFTELTNSREYTGKVALLAPEAKHLEEYIRKIKPEKGTRMVVLDCHGWMNETLGDEKLGAHFTREFGFRHRTIWGGGYFSNWTKSIGCESLLVEYPPTSSLQDVYDKNLHSKTINAINSILSDGTVENPVEKPIYKKGTIVNTSTVNVRKGAGTSYPIIGVLYSGSSVNVLSEYCGYYKIQYAGSYGYVECRYVNILENTEINFGSDAIASFPASVSTGKKELYRSSDKVRLTYKEAYDLYYGRTTDEPLPGSLGTACAVGSVVSGVADIILPDKSTGAIAVLKDITGFIGDISDNCGFVVSVTSALTLAERNFWTTVLSSAITNGAVEVNSVIWKIDTGTNQGIRYESQIFYYEVDPSENNISNSDQQSSSIKDIIVNMSPKEIQPSINGKPAEFINEIYFDLKYEDVWKAYQKSALSPMPTKLTLILAIGGMINGPIGTICSTLASTYTILGEIYKGCNKHDLWSEALKLAIDNGMVRIKLKRYKVETGESGVQGLVEQMILIK